TDDGGTGSGQTARRAVWPATKTHYDAGTTGATPLNRRQKRQRNRADLQSPPDHHLSLVRAGGLTGFSVPLLPTTEIETGGFRLALSESGHLGGVTTV